MYEDASDRRNASGCTDPTYSEVVEQVKRDGRKNMSRCVRVMLAVARRLRKCFTTLSISLASSAPDLQRC